MRHEAVPHYCRKSKNPFRKWLKSNMPKHIDIWASKGDSNNMKLFSDWKITDRSDERYWTEEWSLPQWVKYSSFIGTCLCKLFQINTAQKKKKKKHVLKKWQMSPRNPEVPWTHKSKLICVWRMCHTQITSFLCVVHSLPWIIFSSWYVWEHYTYNRIPSSLLQLSTFLSSAAYNWFPVFQAPWFTISLVGDTLKLMLVSVHRSIW